MRKVSRATRKESKGLEKFQSTNQTLPPHLGVTLLFDECPSQLFRDFSVS